MNQGVGASDSPAFVATYQQKIYDSTGGLRFNLSYKQWAAGSVAVDTGGVTYVDIGGTMSAATVPSVTVSTNATEMVSVEIGGRTATNFWFQLRNSTGIVTGATWEVYWTALTP
jgi:hypothetical protein